MRRSGAAFLLIALAVLAAVALVGLRRAARGHGRGAGYNGGRQRAPRCGHAWRCGAAPPLPGPEARSFGPAPPRVGIDVGGVLCSSDPARGRGSARGRDFTSADLVPGAVEGVAALIRQFGPEHVFIVSKVRLGGAMHLRARRWLLSTIDLPGRTGFLPQNLRFCGARCGRRGKGPVARELGLSSFIDDRCECLWSVYCDPAGNARRQVDVSRGKLVLFASGGRGPPPRPCALQGAPPGLVVPVAGWAGALAALREPRGGPDL